VTDIHDLGSAPFWLYIGYTVRITLHGLPTAKLFGGMSFVTTLPAPITLFAPIVTPGRMIALTINTRKKKGIPRLYLYYNINRAEKQDYQYFPVRFFCRVNSHLKFHRGRRGGILYGKKKAVELSPGKILQKEKLYAGQNYKEIQTPDF